MAKGMWQKVSGGMQDIPKLHLCLPPWHSRVLLPAASLCGSTVVVTGSLLQGGLGEAVGHVVSSSVSPVVVLGSVSSSRPSSPWSVSSLRNRAGNEGRQLMSTPPHTKTAPMEWEWGCRAGGCTTVVPHQELSLHHSTTAQGEASGPGTKGCQWIHGIALPPRSH